MQWSEYTKDFKYNIQLATPIILSMMGHTLVGMVDSMMVGRLGTTELAAVSLGNSVIFFAMVFGIGFSTAITTLTAEAHGAGDFRKSKSVLKHGLLMNTLFSFVLVFLLLFAEHIMRYTKQEPAVVALALPYVHLVSVSLIPLMVFQAFKQFADGLSMTKYAMIVTFGANGVNVLLNYVFIYGNLGAPAMGVLGAGVGTLVARFLMPVFMWYILYRKRRLRAFVGNFRWRAIHLGVVRKLFLIGIPSSLQMFFEAGIFIAATWISGALGSNYQAANQIALSMASFTFMISSGMSVVATIRVSNYKGNHNYIALRRVARSIFLFIVGCQVILALGYVLLRSHIPVLFLNTADLGVASDIEFVLKASCELLIIAGIFQIPDGIQVVALGALRGIQDVKVPVGITFVAYWLIAFPISYYLGLYTEYKATGIWIGLCVGLSVAAVLLLWRFHYFAEKMVREHHS